MNQEEKELQQFEQDLHQLIPAEPGEALTNRIFAAFDTPREAAPAEIDSNVIALPKSDPENSWLQPLAIAAAVALVAGVIAIIGFNRPATKLVEQPPEEAISLPVQPVKFVPAGAQNTYQGTNVDGIIFTEDRKPMQAVRHQFIDTYIWENPEDGSRVEVQVPVERRRLIPVPTD